VLLGFSPFERHQLETVLRLAAARAVRYRLEADAGQAELAVVDADDAAALAALQRLGLPALRVGGSPVDGAAPLARPINVAQVVRALDALARRGPPPSPPVQRALDELAHVAGVPPPWPRARLLVAAQEATATPLLLAPLQRAGCELLRVRSGHEAIERARDDTLDLVVIDAGLDGLDGYHACRSIKQRAQAEGRRAPPVVLLAAGPAAVHRVRAELAGADGLLEAPLDAEALLALLPPRGGKRAP
jgi:CheY-like chemotaxis protein